MASVQAAGEVNIPIAEAVQRICAAAYQLGFTYNQFGSSQYVVVLTKGLSLLSYGSKMTVAMYGNETTITQLVVTHQTYAMTNFLGSTTISQLLRALAQ